jgi:hypothetical protein
MDINTNAHRIVRALTEGKQGDKRSEAGRAGGVIGGPARAAMLTPEKRKAIAMKANQARWKMKEGARDVSKND